MTSSWSCDGCGVKVSFAPGFSRAEPPVGWGRADQGWLCLGCRRQHAVDEAAAEADGSVAEVRRRALTEFELQRDPSAPDHVIAKRVKCATSYVLPVRAELLDAGVLPAP